MNNILFGLQIESTEADPAADWDTGGPANVVTIYEDGTIEYNHFLFHSDGPVSSVKAEKGHIIVGEIEKILTKYKKDIERIPVNIDNRTWDGEWYIFTFNDKTITIDNPGRIEYKDIISLPLRDEEEIRLFYYNNTLLDIQDEIFAVLARYGFKRHINIHW